MARCECTLDPNDMGTCTAANGTNAAAGGGDVAAFRPEFVAGFELCKGRYTHVANLLTMLLWSDAVFTVIETSLDLGLRVFWCCKGSTQRSFEMVARAFSLIFFISFGFMLLAVTQAVPGGIICDQDGALIGSVPGCRFTAAWSEENSEEAIFVLISAAVAIAVPNLIVFLLDAVRFWLSWCSDTFMIDDDD